MSEAATDANAAAGSAEGLNAAANLWFVSPPHSYDAALAQRHGAAARAEAYYALGEAHRLRGGRQAEAIGAFRAAIALQPSHDDAAHALGIALAEDGRVGEALPRLMRLAQARLPAAACSPAAACESSAHVAPLQVDGVGRLSDAAPSAWLNGGHMLSQASRPSLSCFLLAPVYDSVRISVRCRSWAGRPRPSPRTNAPRGWRPGGTRRRPTPRRQEPRAAAPV